jgi:hypothetical protein
MLRHYGPSLAPGLHPLTLDRLVEPWLGDRGQPAFCARSGKPTNCTPTMFNSYGTHLVISAD